MAIEIDPVCGMQVDTETTDLKLRARRHDLLVLRPGLHARRSATTRTKYLDPDYKPSM